MIKKFIDIKDLSIKEIKKILNLSNSNIKNNCLKNKTIGLAFDNPSTRTRISFIRNIVDLKGNFLELDMNKLNLSRYETLEDTATMFALYLDGFIFRSNKHSKLELFSNNFRKPVINAMTDISHPCQAISDYYTLTSHFKIKKIKIIWLGDITNVLMSLIDLANKLKIFDIHIVSSKNIIKKKRIEENSHIKLFDEIPFKLLNKYHCVMTDTFSSMNDKYSKNKISILKKFQVNESVMKFTNSNCVFMHCLPAKIGSEVTRDIIYGKKSIVTKQAKNRMIVQKGILKWLGI